MARHYATHARGHIVQACGVGKALLTAFFLQRQTSQTMPTYVIGVPSVQLVQQMVCEMRRVFPACSVLCVCGPLRNPNLRISTTTKCEDISRWCVENHDAVRVLVTTYASSGKVVDSRIHADVRVGDECHHLARCGNAAVSPQAERSWMAFWDIPATKSLFLTATPVYADGTDPHSMCGTMSDESLFGQRLHECDRSVKWAIENGCITDYSVVMMDHDVNEVDAMIELVFPDKPTDDTFNTLFISASVTLEAIVKYREEGRCTHTLIYTNTIEEAECVDMCVSEILKRKLISGLPTCIYHKALHSRCAESVPDELSKFRASAFGVVSCAYLFSEGFDMNELDAVTIGSSMHAHVRIVQSVLRPNRIHPTNPHKKATVLLPTVGIDDWSPHDRPERFANVKRLLDELHEVDDASEEKVCVCDVRMRGDDSEREPMPSTPMSGECVFHMHESAAKLNRFRIKRLRAGTLKHHLKVQREYSCVRALNKQQGIQSVAAYNRMRLARPDMFNAAPSEYFGSPFCKGVWKGWSHFLGFDTSALPSTVSEWRSVCQEKRIYTASQYTAFVESQCHATPAVLPHDPENFAHVVPTFEFTGLSGELDKLSMPTDGEVSRACTRGRRRRR